MKGGRDRDDPGGGGEQHADRRGETKGKLPRRLRPLAGKLLVRDIDQILAREHARLDTFICRKRVAQRVEAVLFVGIVPDLLSALLQLGRAALEFFLSPVKVGAGLDLLRLFFLKLLFALDERSLDLDQHFLGRRKLLFPFVKTGLCLEEHGLGLFDRLLRFVKLGAHGGKALEHIQRLLRLGERPGKGGRDLLLCGDHGLCLGKQLLRGF